MYGQEDVETPVAKRLKAEENAAALVLATLQQNGASSSSSQHNGISRSSPVQILSSQQTDSSNSSSSSQNAAERALLKQKALCIDLLAQKKFSEAIEMIRSALGVKGAPKHLMPSIISLLSNALSKRGHPGDILTAIDHLRMALSMPVQDHREGAELHLLLSSALGRTNNPRDIDAMLESAEAGLKLAEKEDELKAKLYNNLAKAYILRNDFQKAVEVLSAGLAIKQQEARPSLFFNLGEAYSGMGKRDDALKSYKEAISCENAEPFIRAACCERLGTILSNGNAYDLDAAIENIQQAIALGDQHEERAFHASLYSLLSVFLLRRSNGHGDFKNALQAANEAIKVKHNDPVMQARARAHYAWVLTQRGRPRDRMIALEQLRTAKAIAHKNWELKARIFYDLASLLHPSMQKVEMDEASKCYLAALSMPISNQLKASIAKGYGDLLREENYKNDLGLALQQYELGASLEHPDGALRAKLFFILGDIYVAKGDFSLGIERYRAGAVVEHNDVSLRVRLCIKLVKTYRARNTGEDLSSAIELLAQLIKIESKNVKKEVELSWYGSIHEFFLQRNQEKDRERALAYCEAAVVLANELPVEKGGFMHRIARMLFDRAKEGDLNLVIDILTKAMSLLEKNPLAVACLSLLGQAYHRRSGPQDLLRAGKCFLEGVRRLDPQTLHLKDELVKGLASILRKPEESILLAQQANK